MSKLEKTMEEVKKVIDICNEKPIQLLKKHDELIVELIECINKHNEIIITYSKIFEEFYNNILEIQEYEEAKERIR